MEPVAKKLCTASTRAVKRIAVEGNIAAGKSTFLRILEESDPGYRVVSEPLTRWCNISADDEEITPSQRCGGNILDMFYKDQKRWAYTFQTYACLSRLRAQMQPPAEELTRAANPVLFYERSVYSDRFVFAHNCHRSGVMSDTEWNMYCDWHSFLTESLPVKLNGIVYLRTDPKICHSRLQKRKRPEESSVPQSYLESLHERHEEWLIEKTIKIPGHLDGIPILSLESNPEFESDEERARVMMKDVAEFLKEVTCS